MIKVSVTQKVYEIMHQLDKGAIGTYEYIGIAYFWDYEYRHYLRDCSESCRKRVHHKLLKTGLPVDGKSDAHHQLISSIVQKDRKWKSCMGVK